MAKRVLAMEVAMIRNTIVFSSFTVYELPCQEEPWQQCCYDNNVRHLYELPLAIQAFAMEVAITL
jgi:hypothetical protein